MLGVGGQQSKALRGFAPNKLRIRAGKRAQVPGQVVDEYGLVAAIQQVVVLDADPDVPEST